MKNALTFVIVWLLVTAAYQGYKHATRAERKSIWKAIAVGALTATVATITLAVIVALF
jgi:hypothetical protein